MSKVSFVKTRHSQSKWCPVPECTHHLPHTNCETVTFKDISDFYQSAGQTALRHRYVQKIENNEKCCKYSVTILDCNLS